MSLPNEGTAAWPPTVLARWQISTTEPGATTVLPDGCSDLIVHVDASGRADGHVSPLTDSAMVVPGRAGEWWLGYRLRPGTSIDAGALLRDAQAHLSRIPALLRAPCPAADELAEVEAALLLAIDAHTRLDARVQDALHVLAQAASVHQAARSLGVSARSLERLTRRATAQPPRFWRGLARVRRAAQGLATAQPLADIAADHGYADQAHFSRDCLRWLGQTPAALRRSPQLLATVAQAGHG